MALDSLVKLFVTVAVIEMMVTVGLGVAVPGLIDVGRDVQLVRGPSWPTMLSCPPSRLGCLSCSTAEPDGRRGISHSGRLPGSAFRSAFGFHGQWKCGIFGGVWYVLTVTSAVIAPAALLLLLPLFSGAVTLPIRRRLQDDGHSDRRPTTAACRSSSP